jgi:hypothetical protein
MPSPVFSAASNPGNVIGGVSVTKGATIAAFLDLSTCVEGQLDCAIATGTSAPTTGTTFSAYHVYAAGGSPPLTLTGAVTAGATSIPVNASGNLAYLHAGEQFAIVSQNAPHAGEIVTLSTAPSGTGAQSLTVAGTASGGGTVNGYSTGDYIYLISQTATFTTTPASSTGTWAASKDYSSALFLSCGQWIIAASNGDATYAITVTITEDKITGFA